MFHTLDAYFPLPFTGGAAQGIRPSDFFALNLTLESEVVACQKHKLRLYLFRNAEGELRGIFCKKFFGGNADFMKRWRHDKLCEYKTKQFKLNSCLFFKLNISKCKLYALHCQRI